MLQQNDLDRIRGERKAQTRLYITVSLSGRVIPEGEPFRCTKCGTRVTTIYNEINAMVEIKIIPSDAKHQKLTENLCHRCNRVYIFA